MGFDEWLANDPAQAGKLCEACDEGRQAVGYQHYANYWCCNKCYDSLQEIYGECDICGGRYELSEIEDHCPDCGLCWECEQTHTLEQIELQRTGE